jgi:hypothetical protein
MVVRDVVVRADCLDTNSMWVAPTTLFLRPRKKKSSYLRSGDLGGQGIGSASPTVTRNADSGEQ